MFAPSPLTTLAAAVAFVATATSAAAQSGCISLSGSSMCPSFSQSYVNPANLTAAYPFFADVTDVASFDTQFRRYYTDYEQFKQTKLHTGLQCNESGTLNATLQWSQTVLCGLFSSYSYQAGCTQNTVNQSTSLVCRETCTDYSASEYAMVGNASYCTPTSQLRPANLTNVRNQTLTNDYTSCTDWTALYSTDPTQCILGVSNEGNCGFGPGTNQQLCSYCSPTSGGSVAQCCYDAKTKLDGCAAIGYPGAALIASVTSVAPGYASTSGASSATGSSSSSASNTAAAGAASAGNRLSGGQIAGLVVGVLAFVIVGAIIFFLIVFCCLGGAAARKRRRDGEAQNDRDGMMAGAARAPTQSPPEKSYHLSEDTNRGRSLDNEKSGSSPMGAAAGGALLGAGAGALASKEGEHGSSTSRPMSTATSGTDGRGTTVASVRCQYTGQTIAPGDTVVAIYPYSAGLSDELDLAPESHEQLTVVRIYDDGWCLLRRSPDNGSTEGAAPLVCCQSSKGELPAHMRPHGESGTGTGSGTTDEETGGATSGAEGGMATSSVGGAVTADEYGFTSDAASR